MTDVVSDARIALEKPGSLISSAMATTRKDPGLYAIHASVEALAQLGLPQHDPSRPIYIGKAERSLLQRDVGDHFAAGKTGSSTLRRSLAALLADELDLRAIPRSARSRRSHWKLTADGEAALSEWMARSLTLAVWLRPLDIALRDVERQLIVNLCPPLNDQLNPAPWPALRPARERMAVMAENARP